METEGRPALGGIGEAVARAFGEDERVMLEEIVCEEETAFVERRGIADLREQAVFQRLA